MRRLAVVLAVGATALVAGVGCTPVKGPPQSVSFSCLNGGATPWVVPADVHVVTATLFGAEGGDSWFNVGGSEFTPGGRGGTAIASFLVTPGEVIHVNVGCAGQSVASTDNVTTGGRGGSGFGIGGQGGTPIGGGGGGGTGLWIGDITAPRLVLAAGGGGGAGTRAAAADSMGGWGGGTAGSPGGNGSAGVTGGGGGGGGSSAGVGTPSGAAGGAGFGGDGGDGAINGFGGGGGGGGFLYGGGGGGASAIAGGGGGGGGGSGFGPPGATLEAGAWGFGDGFAMIQYRTS